MGIGCLGGYGNSVQEVKQWFLIAKWKGTILHAAYVILGFSLQNEKN